SHPTPSPLCLSLLPSQIQIDHCHFSSPPLPIGAGARCRCSPVPIGAETGLGRGTAAPRQSWAGQGRSAAGREQRHLGARPWLPLRGVRRRSPSSRGAQRGRVPLGPAVASCDGAALFRSVELSLPQRQIRVLVMNQCLCFKTTTSWRPDSVAARGTSGTADNVPGKGQRCL
ncbi:unnamed protein product, partial [Urochloa humidicola]